MKTLSFLVPCYNVESCVHNCIDSMLVEDILDDIEILLINDGSKDNTLDILKEYETKYPSTIRIINKENGGWGTAINLGIRETQGKYLKEVDADDWIDTKNLKAYIEHLKTLDCDYIATEYTEYFKATDKYELHTYQQDIYNKTMSLNDFWDFFPTAWDFPIHAITYRTKMLRDNSIKVGERYYGDIEYNLYPLPYVNTICVLPINVTIYFRGSDVQSTSTKGYAKHYKDYVKMSQRLVCFHHTLPSSIQSKLYQFINGTVKGTVLKAYNLMMSPVYAGKEENVCNELKQYDRWLRENDDKLYKFCGRQRKHGIAYIRMWRWFGINVMKLTHHK